VVCFLAQSDISPSRVGRSALGSFPIASAIRWAAVLSDGANENDRNSCPESGLNYSKERVHGKPPSSNSNLI
jgi:hypothetical protein